MRKPFMSIGSAALALLMFGTSLPAVQAAPLRPEMPVAAAAESDVVQVRHRQWHGDRDWRRDGRDWRRDDRRAYYRGHRGYDHYRPGYRRHNGFWFPAAAFATGMILGGAINSRPAYAVPRGLTRDHVEYCMSKYRSYRVSDDTYQPNYGPRRRCR